MDLKLKGITWVGNIYQKFEAVCQEVDNIVSQDAIKYVENQVQSAGENVKKLCPDVVLDLVSPVVGSSITKHKTQSQPSRRNAEVGFLLKSTTAKNEISKDHVDTVDRQSQDPDAFDLPKHSQHLVVKGQFSGHHTNEVEEHICECFENNSTETKSHVRPKESSHMNSRQNVVKSIPLTVHSNSTTAENSFRSPLSMEPSAGIAQNINQVQSGQRENVVVSIEEVPLVADDVVVKASTASSFTMEKIDPENPVENNYVVSIKQKTENFATEVANWVSPIKEMSSEYLPPVQNPLDDLYQNVNEFHVHGKGKLDLYGEDQSLITAETAPMEFSPLDGLSLKNGSFQGSVIDPSTDDFSGNVSDDMVETPAAASCRNKNFQSSPQVETDEAEYDPSYLDTLATSEMDRLCLGCSLSSGSLLKNTSGSLLEKSLKKNPISCAKVNSTISNSHRSYSTAPVPASDVMTPELDMCSLCRMQPLKPRGGSDSDSTNSSMESIALGNVPKLEQRCVIVDDSQLHAVSSRVRKLRSYRKRIQDVFTSKKRLVKDYELLAIWYGDAEIEPGQNNSTTLSALNSSASFNGEVQACDSDWELL